MNDAPMPRTLAIFLRNIVAFGDMNQEVANKLRTWLKDTPDAVEQMVRELERP